MKKVLGSLTIGVLLVAVGCISSNAIAAGRLPGNINEAIMAFDKASVFMKLYDECYFDYHHEYNLHQDLKVYETVLPVEDGATQNPYHRYAVLYKNTLLYEESFSGGAIFFVYFGKIGNKGVILSNIQNHYGINSDRVYLDGKEILPDIWAVNEIRKLSKNYLIIKYSTSYSGGGYKIGIYNMNSGKLVSFIK